MNDYAYACIMVQMLNTGMEIYELASKKGGTLPASSGLYESVKKTFKDAAAGNTYTDKDVWEIIKSDGIYYLRSRMFGSLFPLNTTWNVRMMGLNDNKSFFLIVPDRLMSRKNNSIGISILVEFNLNNTISYDDFLEEKHNMYPVVEQSRKTIGNHEYDIMVFEDTAKYQNMGGMRGYYITTRVEYKDKSNSGIEMPIEIEFNSSSAETGKSSYYALKDYFNRINQNINVGILVDSSVEIFEEASDFIFQYLEYVIFE